METVGPSRRTPAFRSEQGDDLIVAKLRVPELLSPLLDRPRVSERLCTSVEHSVVVLLVGPSGIGKSTLASLLLRLYDPDAGTIYVDGMDLRTLSVDSYITQTAVVLQETLLFHATVSENIAYGRPGATQEEIVASAVLADADGFIRKLPQAYETLVGERGTTLSGGQRQRIAIARALVRDAPILVLDEPTTGLDAQAERSVLDALETLMRGRTTLMITHNESTVRRADRVLRIENGQLLEHGSAPVPAGATITPSLRGSPHEH